MNNKNYFYELKKEKEKAELAVSEAYNIARQKGYQAKTARKNYNNALARLFASVSSPLTAKQIANLSGNVISKYSVAQYFLRNENKGGIGDRYSLTFLPNYKKMRTKVVRGEQKYALLDDNGNPTNIIITKEHKYRVYWTD